MGFKGGGNCCRLMCWSGKADEAVVEDLVWWMVLHGIT